MRRSFLLGIIPVVAFAAVSLASTKEAHAGPYLGLDLNLGSAFKDKVDFSYGTGARFGYKFNIPRSYVWLLPEGGIHFMKMGSNSQGLGFDHALTVNGGARFGLQGPVQPNVFGHLGYGVLPDRAAGGFGGTGGPATDVGVGVDFKIGPIFTLGLQVAYNAITVLDSVNDRYGSARWVNFGINGGFNFGEPAHRRVYYR